MAVVIVSDVANAIRGLIFIVLLLGHGPRRSMDCSNIDKICLSNRHCFTIRAIPGCLPKLPGVPERDGSRCMWGEVQAVIPISDDNPGRTVPIVTWAIIAACVAVYLWE